MDKEFADTNVLIYAFDRRSPVKQAISESLIDRLWTANTGCVSLQVLQEFYNAATRKLRMAEGDATQQVRGFARWTIFAPEIYDVLAAIELHQARQISYWDALIVHSAQRLGCKTLWSEDLADGSRWGGVTVRNPFSVHGQ